MDSWECPVCGCNAYQRFGGVNVPAFRFEVDPNGVEIRRPTSFRVGKHFMCKGCSVFFSNPNLFNKNKNKSRPNGT